MMPESHSPASAGEGGPLLAGRAPMPVWLILLFFVLLYWGMVYFDQRSGWFDDKVYAPYTTLAEVQLYQPPAGGSKERGRAIYENNCALCHNSDGMGKPNQAPPFVKSDWVLGPADRMIRIPLAGLSAPPFVKSDWVLGPADRMIRIPLAGLSGPVQVNGQEWNLSMAAMGVMLSDEDLAAVLTYIRQSWGNNASEVTPEQVKKVKAEIGNRTQPWSAAELMSVQ